MRDRGGLGDGEGSGGVLNSDWEARRGRRGGGRTGWAIVTSGRIARGLGTGTGLGGSRRHRDGSGRIEEGVGGLGERRRA